VCELIPDLLEHSDGSERVFVVYCHLSDGQHTLCTQKRIRTVTNGERPYSSNARICSPNPCSGSCTVS
jgi:hypothetical protein